MRKRFLFQTKKTMNAFKMPSTKNIQSKKMPKKNDNSWLGIVGETWAFLYDSKSNCLGYCMDTPNCIAYAMAINSNVLKVKTSFDGEKQRKNYEDRFWHVILEEEAKYFKNYGSIGSKENCNC